MGVPSITNTQTAAIQFSISSTLDTQKVIAEQLATGQRIIQLFMDPAGLAIGTSLAVSLSDLQEALKTANQAEVVINIAYGGVKSITDLLKRLENLSFMALNGSASAKDKALVNKEAQQLKQEIDRIASSTTFNSKQLINGDRDQTSLVVSETHQIQGYTLKNNQLLDNNDAPMTQPDGANKNVKLTNNIIESKTGGDKIAEGGLFYVTGDSKVYKAAAEIDQSSNAATKANGVEQFKYEGTATAITSLSTAGASPVNVYTVNAGKLYSTPGAPITGYSLATGQLNDATTALTKPNTAADKVMFDGSKVKSSVGTGKAGWTKDAYIYIDADKAVYKATAAGTAGTSAPDFTPAQGTKVFTYEGDAATTLTAGAGITAIKTADGNDAYVPVGDGTLKLADSLFSDLTSSTLNFSQYNGSIMDELNTVNIINFDSKNSVFKVNLAADGKTIMNLAGKPSGYTLEGTTLKKDGAAMLTIDDAADIKKIKDPITSTELYSLASGKINYTGASKLEISTRIYNTGDAVYDYNAPDAYANPMVYQVGDEPNQQVAFAFSALSTKVLNIADVDFTQGDMKSKQYALQINAALTQITEYAAQVGAYQSRFNFISENLSLSIENVDAARAQFLDADFTEATKDFTQNTAKLQAAVTAQAKLIQTPQILNQLLQSM